MELGPKLPNPKIVEHFVYGQLVFVQNSHLDPSAHEQDSRLMVEFLPLFISPMERIAVYPSPISGRVTRSEMNTVPCELGIFKWK